MARTQKFRDQHSELMNIASDLQSTLDESCLAADASKARSTLSRLMGKLTLHLSAEDKVLYPELQGSNDPKVVSLAKRFSTEMSSVAPKVVEYNQRWSTPTSIKSDPVNFITETKQILNVLSDRIKRENNELYAAADQI